MGSSLSLGFDDLACFVGVAERGGFTAAAKDLAVRKTTVSRHVQQLEARLGVQLFVRTTRAVTLTADGHTYLEHAKRAVDAWRAATRAMGESRAGANGVLRVTTTPFFGDVLLAPVVLEYLRAYPEVAVDLELSTQTQDVVTKDFDLAIRFGALADSTLISRKIGMAFVGCFASRAYLKRHGTPKTPKDLERHAIVSLTPGAASVSWPFQRMGRRVVMQLRPRLASASFTLNESAARAGVGIVRLPGPVVRRSVERGELVHVLAEWATPLVPVHVVMPRRLPLPSRTRAFIDLLVASAATGPLGQLGAPQPKPVKKSSQRAGSAEETGGQRSRR